MIGWSASPMPESTNHILAISILMSIFLREGALKYVGVHMCEGVLLFFFFAVEPKVGNMFTDLHAIFTKKGLLYQNAVYFSTSNQFLLIRVKFDAKFLFRK